MSSSIEKVEVKNTGTVALRFKAGSTVTDVAVNETKTLNAGEYEVTVGDNPTIIARVNYTNAESFTFNRAETAAGAKFASTVHLKGQ